MPADFPAAKAPLPARASLRPFLALLVLLAALALATLANRLPAPAPETAPATQFSADRAMRDVRAIATAPHPIGSAEIERTRHHLVARMSALGLDPQVRAQTAIVTRSYFGDLAIGAQTHNIVGELKGTDPALPAVLLMAHYDTAPLSPGAGDDTSGVAVALEVARALKAASPSPRSVIFLFTDGEEAGLLGASGFFEQDPLRRRAGLVVNLEARGDSGKALMFQTGPDNRGLIEAYRRTVASPAADSLMVTIYKRMPNDTDLTAALEQGFAGMNFAFAGHQMAYHTPLSTPENLNRGSIQHMGDQVLPVIRDFARAKSLKQTGGDMVFADLFGQYLLAYPSWVGWLLAVAAVGAAFAATAAAIARRTVRARDALAGAGGVLAMLLGVATTLSLGLRLTSLLLRDVASPYALVGQFGWLLAATVLLALGTGAFLVHAAGAGRHRAAALSLAAAGLAAALLGNFSLVLLAIGLAAALVTFTAVRRPVPLAGWFAGAVALIALLAILMQVFLSNGAHALVWPLILLIPALALLLFAPARAEKPAALVAIALPAALLAGLMARSGHDFFLMIGSGMPAVVAPFIVLALVALAPLVWAARGLGRAAILSVLAGLALFAAAGIKGRTPTAASPEMVEAFHIADLDRGRAQWVSGKLDQAGWVRATLTQDGGTPKQGSIAPLGKDKHWIADARPAAFARPGLALTVSGADKARRIDLVAANANGGRYMRIFVRPSVELGGLALMGRAIPGTMKAGEWSQLTFHASGTDPVRLGMAAPQRAGRVEVQLVEVRDGWPEGSKAPPLPPHVVPYRRAGNSMIIARAATKW